MYSIGMIGLFIYCFGKKGEERQRKEKKGEGVSTEVRYRVS